ncbi:MAG TPA: BamA/TamA family outer membrane protein [Polyangiaceae bacterium]|nr:BamA/TamA family outer membrane protein [Polyangiaceae bacterium]
MSGFPPAFVAIRDRLRRARLVALLLGLCHSGSALGQIPVMPPPAPPPAAPPSRAEDRLPDAALLKPPPATPAPQTTPGPEVTPELETAGAAVEERDGNGPGPSREGGHVPLRYTLEAIQIRGNTRTERRVVLRYVPFKPGNVFDVDDPEVELSRYRLLGTGFFRDVQYSLKKGSERGLVVLVIDVTERNTIVINDISMGLAADAARNGRVRTLSGYAGLDLAETNLAGTGITLGGAMAVASNQLALRVRFLDPAFLGTSWMIGGTLLYNDATDYFGTSGVQWVNPNQGTSFSSAEVDYSRFGGSIGVGRDLSVSTQLWLHYRLESLNASYPWEASQVRGFATEPIDFDIIRGRSVLSTLRGTLQVDTRDHPFLPTRGSFSTLTTEVGLLPAGRDYDYARVDAQSSRWFQLPWHGHVLRLSAFAGAIAGNAPFFEQYYVGDFSDFLPDRVLGVSFDHRYPPNFLGTEIVEVRYGKYALSANTEYRIPLYRGHHTIFGIDFFGSGGAYSVSSDRDFTHPPRAYSGFARFPLDLTFNLGFRMDTSAGGFVFAFSNVLGFLPVRGQGPAGND